MSIFDEIKGRVSVRDVASYYGLKINRNGMVCCPFHEDKHPSMKTDQHHFHCFGCGAHGDAIGFVAKRFGIGQYEAACKINEDLGLGLAEKSVLTSREREEIANRQSEHAWITDVKNKFQKWRRRQTDDLLECDQLIEQSKEAVLKNAEPHVVYLPNGLVYMMHVKPIIGYWLDILCMGTEEEIREFFLTDGKEVSRVVTNVKRAGEAILGRDSKSA